MNAARTTNAAIRHNARIAAVKSRIANATAAQQHASCRGDFETARMWLGLLSDLRTELVALQTMPIHDGPAVHHAAAESKHNGGRAWGHATKHDAAALRGAVRGAGRYGLLPRFARKSNARFALSWF